MNDTNSTISPSTDPIRMSSTADPSENATSTTFGPTMQDLNYTNSTTAVPGKNITKLTTNGDGLIQTHLVNISPNMAKSSSTSLNGTLPNELTFHFGQINDTLMPQNQSSTLLPSTLSTILPTMPPTTAPKSLPTLGSLPPIFLSIFPPSRMNSTDDIYDDGFGPDYKDLLEEQSQRGRAEEAAWSGVLIGASFSNIFLLLFLLAMTKGKRGFFGLRLYTFNLAIFAIIQIIVLLWTASNDQFGLRQLFPFCLQDFMDKYNGSLLEVTQIVYLSATTALMLDCIQRYRNNGLGLGKTSWILAIFFLDLLPMLYIFVKGISFEYTQIRPKPLAIYHVIALVIFSLVGTGLGLAIICLPFYRCCHRGQEEIVISEDQSQKHAIKEKIWFNRLTSNPGGESAPKPFTLAKLIGLFLFILLTAWPQYTVFNLGVDLQPVGGIEQAKELTKEIAKDAKEGGLIGSILKIVQQSRIVFWLMSIQKWASMMRPFLESLFALLLLLIPSIGSKFKIRKICPSEECRQKEKRPMSKKQNNGQNHLNSTTSFVQEQLSLSASQIQIPTAPRLPLISSSTIH